MFKHVISLMVLTSVQSLPDELASFDMDSDIFPEQLSNYLQQNPNYSIDFLKKLDLPRSRNLIKSNVLENFDRYFVMSEHDTSNSENIEIWEEDISESYDNMWMEVLDDVDTDYLYLLDELSGGLISSKFRDIWWDYHYALLKDLGLERTHQQTDQCCQDSPGISYCTYIHIPKKRISEITQTIQQQINNLEEKKEFNPNQYLEEIPSQIDDSVREILKLPKVYMRKPPPLEASEKERLGYLDFLKKQMDKSSE